MRFLSALTSSRLSLACWRVGKQLSAFVDGALPHADRREVTVHLRECRRCSIRYEELTHSRDLLKRLPAATPPLDLNVKLRTMAASEASRRRQEVYGQSMVRFAWEGMKQRTGNMMKPLAIPFAGGLVSAMVLFSMLVPAYPGAARATGNDVPTALYQEPTVKSMAPFGITDDEVVVEVILDDQGTVVDYSLPHGKVNAELRREIENKLLFARFTPALSFGQPTTGRVRLSFRRSRIDVKG